MSSAYIISLVTLILFAAVICSAEYPEFENEDLAQGMNFSQYVIHLLLILLLLFLVPYVKDKKIEA